MKRNLITPLMATAMMLLAGQTAAQTAYLATSFDEGIPDTFSLYDLDQNEPSTDTRKMGFEVGKPWVALKVDKDSVSVAASTSWYKKGATSNDWMVTPAISVASAKAVVSWRAKASDKSYADGYSVYISEAGPDPTCFDTASPVLRLSKENAEWTERAISLADYAGKTVYIAFVNDSRDKALLYIDDLFVGVPSKVGFRLDFGRCYDGYGDIAISGKAFATGQDTVDGFTVGFQLEGGKAITKHFDQQLQPGREVDFKLDETINLARNATVSYTAWVESGDDRSEMSSKLSAYLWKVVTEETTGTWCGWCIRGMATLENMRNTYPDGFIAIAVHNDAGGNVPDSMAIPGEQYLKDIFSHMGSAGFPHAVTNRNALYWDDPAKIPAIYTGIKAANSNYTGLEATASYDAATGKVKSLTRFFFAQDVPNANYRLAYVVLENDVHRTHAQTGIINNYCGYDQVNYYAGGANGEMYGYEDKPRIINADDIWYQDVARGIFPDYNGLEGALPAAVSEGDELEYEYEFDMPQVVLNTGNTELVVMLLSRSGVVINADKCPIVALPSAVEPTFVSASSKREAVFSLSGSTLTTLPRKGFYLVRQSDGTVRKMAASHK